MRKLLILVGMVVFISFSLYGQGGSQLSFNVTPNVQYPFQTDPRYFTLGGGVDVSGEFQLPVVSFLGIHLNIGYSYLPIWTGDGTNLVSFGGGLGIHFPKLGRISTQIFGTGGYYFGFLADSEGGSGGNLFFHAGGRVGFGISPAFDLGVSVKYSYLADGNGGALVSGLSFGVSSRYSFLRTRQLKIEELYLDNAFPVLYKHYENHSIGKVVLHNAGAATLDDIEVTFFVDKYMDNPTVCRASKTVPGGESAEVELYALFAEKVLDITEATVVSGNVAVSYTQNNKPFTVEYAGPLRLFDRHAITWDDDRKAAAYVTYKDPAVIDIAKVLARTVKERGAAIDTNLSTAMALHGALREYGMNYVVDPTTPFVEFSENAEAVDYIQFPRNTLHYKSGDCDDLSILYASLLQAVGIETAFITIPGHIFMAFALTLPPEEARKSFSNPDDIIVEEDRAWVPVEITKVNSSFLEAWKVGSMEWTEHDASGKARMYPMQDSWKIYEPIGYIGESAEFTFLSDQEIASIYGEARERFISREVFAQTEGILETIEQRGKSARSLNKLGTVYARYGQYEEAQVYFSESLQIRESFPVVMNIGNLHFLRDELEDSLTYYTRAERLNSESAVLFLQLSRVHHRFGNFDESKMYFDKVKSAYPELAARYSYLDISEASTGRASEQDSAKEGVLWLEIEE